MVRNAAGDSIHQIPVRIEESNAFAILNILADHRFDQR